MYVVNHRFLEGIPVQRVGRTYANFNWHEVSYRYRYPRVIEGIYSWRTGRNAVSDPPVSPSQPSKVDGFGVHLPEKGGNLIDKLSSRKAYIEEVQRAAFPVENNDNGTSTNRVSRSDSGHLFGKLTVFRTPIVGDYTVDSPGSSKHSGQLIMDLPGCYNASPYNFGFNTRSSVLATQSQRQGIQNMFFASSAPDRNEASLGVTLVELMRGDIPTVLRNLKKMIDDYQSIYKTMGSDYLNVVFGWQPLINEIASVIKVGMSLDRLVYYESYRRKRQYDGISSRTNSSISLDFSGHGTIPAYTYPTHIQRSGTGTSTLDLNLPFEANGLETLKKEDYHLTSRYTGLAKPTLRANYHNDRAMDIIKELGILDDPRFLWDLTPWSWFVDWFTTMGDSVSNAATYSPKKGKYAIDYAYVTSKHTVEERLSLGRRGSSWLWGYASLAPRTAVSTAISVTKWRDRATPYGFGTRMGSLTAGQFGILTALGLARSR